ncbi:MAG: DUF6851 domain-containing protein [Flavobacteriales bacterium]
MRLFILSIIALLTLSLNAQNHSVAREWNEVNLNAIRNDLARPTVTARNLFHTSAAMYDAWSVYDSISRPYFLGQNLGEFYIPFNGIPMPDTPEETEANREEAISYAAYRLLSHRYADLPSENEIAVLETFDDLMNQLGYPTDVTTTDYESGNPAALGNYIAEQVIAYGFQDGSLEQENYENQYYGPVNDPLITSIEGNSGIEHPDRWQPLTLLVAIDQLGNPLPINTPEFLSPEWGNVAPFSLTEGDKTTEYRDEDTYQIYCDPGAPAYLDQTTDLNGLTDPYKWNHTMVLIWSSLLAHDNGVMIDASPNNIGNATEYPESMSIEDLEEFYNYYTGLDSSQGYDVNPATGEPYDVQMVPMGDYGRVLAEFWADGPDSETPPGHWYSILNYVNDHPDLEKRWNGTGELLDDLEWDIKSYLALGGAMHDCAIAAWSIKGWYDYVRPISAIRYMGEQGQCTDSTLSNYSPAGLPLIEGFIEIVEEGDPLEGVSQENLNKIKVKAWKGPAYLDQIDLNAEIIDGVQDSTIAGVDWILSGNWWPYQRPTFVSPPFAGYVSGHSTYSRAAAHILESITGDEYFPGGMGIFDAPQDDFLVFETGPSQFVELQWAKYKDASDQCSLSRIFGGIHPPVDDIPGRKIGAKIGISAFHLADSLANQNIPRIIFNETSEDLVNDDLDNSELTITVEYNKEMDQNTEPVLLFSSDISSTLTQISSEWSDSESFVWTYLIADVNVFNDNISYTVNGAVDLADGQVQEEYFRPNPFIIDTENPTLESSEFSSIVNEGMAGESVDLILTFNEAMASETPVITWINEDPTLNSLSINSDQPAWISDAEFAISYEVIDADEELYNMQLEIGDVTDAAGNPMITAVFTVSDFIDTRAPEFISISSGTEVYNESAVGIGTVLISVSYDDDMGEGLLPQLEFTLEDPESTLELNTMLSGPNGTAYEFVYDLIDEDLELADIDVSVSGLTDDAGNIGSDVVQADLFSIDTKAPSIVELALPETLITEEDSDSEIFYSVLFDEIMDPDSDMIVEFSPTSPQSLTIDMLESGWITDTGYVTFYGISDQDEEEELEVQLTSATDLAGNPMIPLQIEEPLVIDNRGPEGVLTANTYNITNDNSGESGFQMFLLFEGDVNQEVTPQISFNNEDPSASISLNAVSSEWIGTSYRFDFNVESDLVPLAFIDVTITNAEDILGNPMTELEFLDYFSIQLDTFLTVQDLTFNELKIYPNPISKGEVFTIELEDVQGFSAEIYDVEGKKLNQPKNLVAPNRLEVSTSGLASGKYFVKLSNGREQQVLRIEVLN